MVNTNNFWHISEYETSKTLKKRKVSSYVVYGEWDYINKKLKEKKINFTITAITPKDFRNFKTLMDI